MKLPITIALSVTALLSFSNHAASNESGLTVLSSVNPQDVKILDSDELDATRGSYFSSYTAAVKFCTQTYPGCIGPILRVGGPWQYKPKWAVKSALTGKYLKY